MRDVNLTVAQGETFSHVVRYGGPLLAWKDITAIPKQAPAHLTVVGHGIPDGWPVSVHSVQGMRQINAESDPPKASDMRFARLIDVDTIEFNDLDASQFSTYTGGGVVRFMVPIDLTGGTSKLTIRDKIGGTALLTLTSPSSGIVLDLTLNTITWTLTATQTAGFTWTKGVYEHKFVSASGVDKTLSRGTITIAPKEIAT